MSGVNKLKALFEPKNPSPVLPHKRPPSRPECHSPSGGNSSSSSSQEATPTSKCTANSSSTEQSHDAASANHSSCDDLGTAASRPWGVKLRSVKIVRSSSSHNVSQKRKEGSFNSSRCHSVNEVDDSPITPPSQVTQRAKSAVHLLHAVHAGLPVHKPPLAPKPANRKSIKPPPLVGKKPTVHRKTSSTAAINEIDSSPKFPIHPSTDLANEVATELSISASPSDLTAPVKEADCNGVQEAVTTAPRDKSEAKGPTIDPQQVASTGEPDTPAVPVVMSLPDSLYLRRNPQSAHLVVNNVSPPPSPPTDDASEGASTPQNVPSSSPSNDGMSTPVFSGSPLMTTLMIDELFERSKSEPGHHMDSMLLEYSCSPSKLKLTNANDSSFELPSTLQQLQRPKAVKEEDLLFPLQEHSDRNSDGSSQLRLSDISCSETEGAVKSPLQDGDVCNGNSSSPLTPEVIVLSKTEKDRKKRFNIASELLETEKVYASKLNLITVEFRAAIAELNSKGKTILPDNIVSRIFLNIRQLYTLSQQVLTDLQKRMDNWEEIEEIGDVISTLAPYLMLYSTYTSGFEDAIKTLTEWSNKEKRFDALVKNFEQQQVLCQGLGITAFMLEPVQRIPRYKLLLESYLKHLEEESPERDKSEKALNIISEAANKANSKIHQLENTSAILSIQRSLVDWDTPLLIPSRRFVKKGLLLKCARKNTQQRMFFLFNDMLLHAVPSGSGIYKFRNELPLYGMQIREPKISSVGHSFYVISTARSLQLGASSSEERAGWISTLNSSIRAETQKRRSLKRESLMAMRDERFAMQAPVWIQDKSVSMCMMCAMPFKLMFRRHHCRGCGKVLCTNCTQWKVYLPYLKRNDRVCFECYHLGSGQEIMSTQECDSPTMSKKGLLNLSGTDADDAVTAGYLHYQDGRKWVKHWYLLRKDMALYRFKAPSDVRALESIPLPGYTPAKEMFKDAFLIRLNHPRATHNFRCETEADWTRWGESLTRACNLEFSPEPDDDPSLPTVIPHKQKLETIESFDEGASIFEDSYSIAIDQQHAGESFSQQDSGASSNSDDGEPNN